MFCFQQNFTIFSSKNLPLVDFLDYLSVFCAVKKNKQLCL